MKITMEQITEALAVSGPVDGNQDWDPDRIARAIANVIEDEVARERDALDAWERGRLDFAVRFEGSPSPPGRASEVASMQERAVAQHRAAIAERVRTNRALVAGIGASVLSLGTVALGGGVGKDVLVPALFGIATQIADALNDQSG